MQKWGTEAKKKNYIKFFIIKNKITEKNIYSLSCPHPTLLFIPSRIPEKPTPSVAEAERTFKIPFIISASEGNFEGEKGSTH